MRCGKCGAENADYVVYCGQCGSELPRRTADDSIEAEASAPRTPAVEPSSARMEPEMRYCTQCGKQISASADWCTFCGKRPWVSASRPWDETSWGPGSDYPHYAEVTKTSKTNYAVVGGVLAIVAGIFALLQGVVTMIWSSSYFVGGGLVCLCGGISALFGLGSIFGGSCAMKSENFGLAIVGAILGMISFGFGIGFVLGLLAVVFIAIAHDEFG